MFKLQMRVSFYAICLLYADLTFGQTTLPTGIIPTGATQIPLVLHPTKSRQGTYGYSVTSGVPRLNADSSTNGFSSNLRLFEIWPDGSTKELGPAHSPHVDIRDLGGGRFSHRYSAPYDLAYILFSTSDATDPITNGRTYVAVQPDSGTSGQPAPATDNVSGFFDTQTNIKTYNLSTSDPNHRTIVISNPSNSNYAFNIAFNKNGFLQSSADLKAEIQNNPSDFINEPIERKIWNFVRRNHKWQLPYTAERWFHHPLLMFNSAGWGLCDDAAATLIHTAKLFGISGRVWGLTHHVVPEVYTNGSWHMYDPTDQAYFLNSSMTGSVASVSELIADHSLITSPLNLAPGTSYAPRLTVAGDPEVIPANYYASLYSPDDLISNWYNVAPVTEIPLVFDLPPRGSVEIGAHNASDAPTVLGDGRMEYQTAYSSVKVALPQGSTGELKVFLIPYKIVGNGNVTLHFQDNTDKSVAISATSNWNQFDAIDRDSYIKSISYAAGNGGMVIHYLANPIRSSVKTLNSVVLKPSGTTNTIANPLSVNFKSTP